MTRTEADLWAQDSVWPDEVYHITRPENLASLQKLGFDLQRHALGRIWGEGVYVAADVPTRVWYEKWLGGMAKTTTLTLKINAKNLFEFDAPQNLSGEPLFSVARMFFNGEQEYDALTEQVKQRNLRLSRQFGNTPATDKQELLLKNGFALKPRITAITLFLLAKGYDSLYVKDYEKPTPLIGGHQIVVFDPKNVVILAP